MSSPLDGCVSFTPFRLSAVASALSLPESWLFFLLWICRFTVGSSGAVPRGNFWGSREGWVFEFSPWFEFCLTSSLSFPGCSHPGLVVAPSPGFDFTSLVAWSLLAPRSWEPPSQSTPFSRSVAFWRLCGAGYSPPLVSSLTAARFAALPLVSRPWTGLCWSQLCEVCSWFYHASWLAQGCIHLLRPIALLLVFWSGVPSGSMLRVSLQVFAMGSPFRVESVSALDRNEVSSSTFLVFGWSLRDGVTLSGRGCLRSRSERWLFAHLP